MYHILIVDDEAAIRDGFEEYAGFLGHQVTQAADGMQAVSLCREQDFDIILMDIMMPKMDGYTACKEIKKLKDIPILMLSARAEEYDKLFGFELGIDDYVTKPFSPKELLARIQVIVTRHRGAKIGAELPAEPAHDVYQSDGLVVDMTAHTVRIDGEMVDLAPKEYELLFYFIENKNIALSREKLLEHVWGYDFFGDDRTVDTHIKTLRMHLGPYKDRIVTVRGMGYRFEG